MKTFADKKRTYREFQVSDWVYLNLKPYRQHSLQSGQLWKLNPKFAGPFQIQTRVGQTACRLTLPPIAKLHHVFHVSVLKKVGSITNVTHELSGFDSEGKVLLQPVKILARRLVKKGESPAIQLLVQWEHLPEEEATWEYFDEISKRFPAQQMKI